MMHVSGTIVREAEPGSLLIHKANGEVHAALKLKDEGSVSRILRLGVASEGLRIISNEWAFMLVSPGLAVGDGAALKVHEWELIPDLTSMQFGRNVAFGALHLQMGGAYLLAQDANDSDPLWVDLGDFSERAVGSPASAIVSIPRWSIRSPGSEDPIMSFAPR